MSKIGRNDPCWCKSGKKYKRCHLDTPADTQRQSLEVSFGEFGARSMIQTLGKTYQEKSAGIENAKGNLNDLINKILEDKKTGNRSKPSSKLKLGRSKIKDQLRRDVVDVVGGIVDQNLFGRSEMCVLFAILLGDALKKLNMSPKIIIGKGTYIDSQNPNNSFTWDHAWVLVDDEIVDGNVDSMIENPVVPIGIEPVNYWGLKENLPNDRKLVPDKEIDEEWIKGNTTYEELQEWRSQLYQTISSLN